MGRTDCRDGGRAQGGTDPDDPEVQSLAARWRELMEYVGGRCRLGNNHDVPSTTRDFSYRLTKAVMRSPLGAAARRLLPASARRRLRSLIDYPVMRRLAGDRASRRLLLRMSADTGSASASAPSLPVRLHGLPGVTVHLRPGTADVAVARDLMVKRPHLPPDAIAPRDAHLVWDLGAHIGLAAADYAARWPNARVVAVELEPHNARLCRLNLKSFGDRCEVIEAAVWHSDGEVQMDDESDGSDTNAFRVDAAPGSGGPAVPALSLDTLLSRTADGGRVDLCKLDIEGAERRVLRENLAWAQRVRTLAVEVHDDYTPEECSRDLKRLGFQDVQPGVPRTS